MDGRPPPDELRERARRLRDLSDRLGFAHRSRRVGGRDRVLVERRHPDGTLGGLGADYTRFVLPAGAGEPGAMVAVAVEGAAGEHLAGRPL
jgi:tRNA A37 methylthiotransferase MiaB